MWPLPNVYYVLAELKKILQRKRLGSTKEVAETEAYFEAKDKLFPKKCIETLEKR